MAMWSSFFLLIEIMQLEDMILKLVFEYECPMTFQLLPTFLGFI